MVSEPKRDLRQSDQPGLVALAAYEWSCGIDRIIERPFGYEAGCDLIDEHLISWLPHISSA